MARALIVGCGCRGRALAAVLAADGLSVRGTTRHATTTAEIAAAGAEAVIADPDRLATLVPKLGGVSVVCWLLGSASGPAAPSLHGVRLGSLLEHIVDTPVRGLVYEAAGTLPDALLFDGERLVREAGERWRLEVGVVREHPDGHEPWLAAMSRAVRDVLTSA